MELSKFKHIRDFYLPVLNILGDAGGTSHVQEIYELFLTRYRSRLDESFFSDEKDGDIKWRDYINRAGYQLVQKGYVRRGHRRGIWELTGKRIPGNSEDI